MQKRKLLKEEIALIPRETLRVFELFVKNRKSIYLVGAGVRDILRSTSPKDCDFTTDANPEEIQEILKEFNPFYDNDFGTVGIPVKVDKNGVLIEEVYEITPFRTDGSYSDNRRPDQVKFGNNLEEDVKRRDFTMNSMVIGPRLVSLEERQVKLGNHDVVIELIDYLGGMSDFESGIIRAVGDADLRFKEDALRMMRAVRFASVLSFVIERKTLEAITKNSYLLSNISRERIRDEFIKILKSSYPADGVHLLVTTDLMRYIIPELLETRGVPQTGHHTLDVYNHLLESLRGCPSSNPIIRLATLLHDIGKPASRRVRCLKCGWVMKSDSLVEKGETAMTTMYQCPKCKTKQSEHAAGTFYGHEVIGAKMAEAICDNLRLTKKDKEKIVTLVRWHMFAYDPKMTDSAIRRFIRNVGKENINDMMLLRMGDRKGGGSKTTSWRLLELQTRIGEQLFEPLEINDLKINGADVMKILKIKPGPKVGEVLKKIFEEVLENTELNNEEYLRKRVLELA